MVLQEIQHCPCGKIHRSSVKQLVVGAGVLETLPEIVKDFAKPFVLADVPESA